MKALLPIGLVGAVATVIGANLFPIVDHFGPALLVLFSILILVGIFAVSQVRGGEH